MAENLVMGLAYTDGCELNQAIQRENKFDSMTYSLKVIGQNVKEVITAPP